MTLQQNKQMETTSTEMHKKNSKRRYWLHQYSERGCARSICCDAILTIFARRTCTALALRVFALVHQSCLNSTKKKTTKKYTKRTNCYGGMSQLANEIVSTLVACHVRLVEEHLGIRKRTQEEEKKRDRQFALLLLIVFSNCPYIVQQEKI